MPQTSQEAICRYLAIRGGGALGGFFGGAIGSIFAPIGALPGNRTGAVIGGAAGAALGALWCPEEDPSSGEWPLVPASAAGQCPTLYQVTFQCECTRYGIFGNPDITYIGDYDQQIMGSLATLDIVTPGIRVGGLGRSAVPPIDFNLNGVTSAGSFNGNDPNQTLKNNGDNQATGQPFNIVYSRIDGLPDNCGSSVPTIPGIPDDIPDINVDPEARTNVDIDLDFGGTIINVNGDLVLTGPVFDFGGNGIGFNFDGLDFILRPNLTIDIGGGNNTPQTPVDPEEPNTDDNAREVAGILYTVTATGSGQSSDGVTGGLYYYPRFGSLRFTGKGEQSEEFEMHGAQGFIPNPKPQMFSDFVFTPYVPTNTASFRKLYQKSCCLLTPSTVR